MFRITVLYVALQALIDMFEPTSRRGRTPRYDMPEGVIIRIGRLPVKQDKIAT
jgi:hypothetical protein